MVDLWNRRDQFAVAGSVAWLEQRRTDARKNLPVLLQSDKDHRYRVRGRHHAGGHRYLSGLRAGCYRVAREVEVEGVFRVGDFVNGDRAGVARVGFILPFEDVDDAVDILRAVSVLGAVFAEVLGGIDHEDAFAGGSVLLIG